MILRLALCLLLLLPAVSIAASPRGENLLQNPRFEKITGGVADRWRPVAGGYRIARDAARPEPTVMSCESDSLEAYHGAMQEVVFNPPVQHPLRVSGWAKAEEAKGEDFCLYLDCWYEDGTNLWGERADFHPGTHDWQQVEHVFTPAKPIAKIQFFILFRHCVGKAWFDDVSLSLAPFQLDRERMLPGVYGGNSLDYSARLSLPAEWRLSVLGGGRILHKTAGRGIGASLAWDGCDADGALQLGGDYTVRLIAKDDLLGEELRHEATATTPSGESRGYIAWTESSMNRVLVNSLPPRILTLSAHIALARNEYESFQVVVRAAPGRTLENCTVEVGDLHGPDGAILSQEHLQWRQVGFVEIAELFNHPLLPEEAIPGWWPDPLLPVSRFSVPGATTQSLWCTLHAPPGTPAGQYVGTVTVRPGDAPATKVAVEATVYDFDLPTRPTVKTAFALMDGFLEQIYGRPLTPELRRAYGDFVLRHRLNPDDISRTDPPDLDDLAHYREHGMNAFNLLNMVEHRGTRPWTCYSDLETYTPEFKAQLIKRLDPYITGLKRRGLADGAYIYTFDERGKDFWPVMREYFGMVKQRWGISTFTTAYVPQDPVVMKDLNIDWNCPLTPRYNLEQAEACRAAGLRVWAYVCLGPRYPYANWLADDPLIESRVIWWQAYHQKMDGLLYWALNYWSRLHNDYIIEPESNGPQLRWGITSGGNHPRLHGDGVLLYPGPHGPIGSIRLANIRDGIEDHDYLHLLAELSGDIEQARAACHPVTTSLVEFTRDPATLSKQRDAIARRIEALRAREK